jgi:hypothetical protein
VFPSAFEFDKAKTIVYYHCTKAMSLQSRRAGMMHNDVSPAILRLHPPLLSPIGGKVGSIFLKGA